MGTDPTTETNEKTAAEEAIEAKAAHQADRPPTDAESRDADKAAADVDVDVDEVGQHFKEMSAIGANVKGEGQIEP